MLPVIRWSVASIQIIALVKTISCYWRLYNYFLLSTDVVIHQRVLFATLPKPPLHIEFLTHIVSSKLIPGGVVVAYPRAFYVYIFYGVFPMTYSRAAARKGL